MTCSAPQRLARPSARSEHTRAMTERPVSTACAALPLLALRRAAPTPRGVWRRPIGAQRSLRGRAASRSRQPLGVRTLTYRSPVGPGRRCRPRAGLGLPTRRRPARPRPRRTDGGEVRGQRGRRSAASAPVGVSGQTRQRARQVQVRPLYWLSDEYMSAMPSSGRRAGRARPARAVCERPVTRRGDRGAFGEGEPHGPGGPPREARIAPRSPRRPPRTTAPSTGPMREFFVRRHQRERAAPSASLGRTARPSNTSEPLRRCARASSVLKRGRRPAAARRLERHAAPVPVRGLDRRAQGLAGTSLGTKRSAPTSARSSEGSSAIEPGSPTQPLDTIRIAAASPHRARPRSGPQRANGEAVPSERHDPGDDPFQRRLDSRERGRRQAPRRAIEARIVAAASWSNAGSAGGRPPMRLIRPVTTATAVSASAVAGATKARSCASADRNVPVVVVADGVPARRSTCR